MPALRRWAAVSLAGAALCGGISVGLTLVAGPAQGHAALVRMTPADGSVVTEPPENVQLVFSEAVQSGYSIVVVTAADGARVNAGAAQVAGTVLRQPLQRLPAAGRYTVVSRVLSGDGHLISARASFTYRPAHSSPSRPSTSSTATASTSTGTGPGPAASGAARDAGSTHDSDDGAGNLLLPAAAGGLLALGGGGLAWRRRRRPT